MYTRAEDTSLCQNAHSADAINLHLHVGIAVWVSQVGQMRPPRGVLGVAFDDHRILVQGVGEGQGRLGFLPGVEIVRLLSAEPVGKWAPYI